MRIRGEIEGAGLQNAAKARVGRGSRRRWVSKRPGGPARSIAVALFAAALLVPSAAPAHEVLHEIERSRAVAVRAYYPSGAPLADVPYEVFGPGKSETPEFRGRADRRGWVAFVPDAPGAWRVRFTDEGGHGLDLEVHVGEHDIEGSHAPLASWAFVLRPLVGLGILAAVFGVLYRLRVRKRASR